MKNNLFNGKIYALVLSGAGAMGYAQDSIKQNKIDEDAGGDISGHQPDGFPVMRDRGIRYGMAIHDKTREPCPDEHPQAIRGKCKKPLGGILDTLARLFLRIHIARHKEEIITDAMQDNTGIQHPAAIVYIAVSETDIAQYPGGHA